MKGYKHMGRVFPDQVMTATGINRTDLVGVCAFLKRSGRATSAVDALRRLEAGEFNTNDLNEEMIRSFQLELPDEELTLRSDNDTLV